MSFAVRIAGCDESKHPKCEGVVTPTSVVKGGFSSKHDADLYCRDVIQNEFTAGDIAKDGGQLLDGADRATILRDYVLIDETSGDVIDAGAHDDHDLFN
ncbi:hypothetical protein [Janibacter terrae]|uniref:hypothetical protein n=1 Tax=Janibacter terrae TaxID=103817 RepID=UPI000837AB8C|nr:hypothetical protein [Janibacter terrae]